MCVCVPVDRMRECVSARVTVCVVREREHARVCMGGLSVEGMYAWEGYARACACRAIDLFMPDGDA